ncbi:MAG: septum site-determining protein MinC [Bacillota bacterium]|nr:septum site-determining protein MinC [Bacillota bacterium]
MEESMVSFKGTVNGLTIILREQDNIDSILEQIEKKVSSAGRFFKGVSLDVKYRGKKLSKEDEEKIFNLLSNKSGAVIKSLSEDTEAIAQAQDSAPTPAPSKIKMRNYFFKGINEGLTKFYKGTVRSGQLINFDGNLVVIGDVNPGAELIASGNVIVMGSLRGIVHAGADGNTEAVVVALNLQPTQLRIANVITRSPDEKEVRNNFIPELAYIKGDTVYIDRYLPLR